MSIRAVTRESRGLNSTRSALPPTPIGGLFRSPDGFIAWPRAWWELLDQQSEIHAAAAKLFSLNERAWLRANFTVSFRVNFQLRRDQQGNFHE
jgi:hypothetical protein